MKQKLQKLHSTYFHFHTDYRLNLCDEHIFSTNIVARASPSPTAIIAKGVRTCPRLNMRSSVDSEHVENF